MNRDNIIEPLGEDDLGYCDKCHKVTTGCLYSKDGKDYLCKECWDEQS